MKASHPRSAAGLTGHHRRPISSGLCPITQSSFCVAPGKARSWRSQAGEARGPSAAEDVFGKLKDKTYVDAAAKRFSLAVNNDVDEDEVVALEMGNSSATLTEVQARYKDKVKEKLKQRAAELKAEEEEKRERLAKNFTLGKEAYECGEYKASVRLLKQGVEDASAGKDNQMGGEAQLWLALAYQACGREEDAIEECRSIEDNHPVRKIRSQAASLRYILEAPKLEIGDDERVKIPLIESYSWRKEKAKIVPSKLGKQAKQEKKNPSYWDRVDWGMPKPDFLPNQWYYQVAWTVVGLVLVVILNLKAVDG